MRVAHINMAVPSSQCPGGFRVETSSNKRFCIRNTNSAGCGLMLFEPLVQYSQVCGYVRGYSYASTDAFAATVPGRNANEQLSYNYVDGVSITYATPPTHVWTYASGHQETAELASNCPCNTPHPGTSRPSYVGSSYYCESGSPNNILSNSWHTSDPLWDGMQCGGNEGSCCNHAGLPWFKKNISPTTASISVRLCLDEATSNENIGIERLELFVK